MLIISDLEYNLIESMSYRLYNLTYMYGDIITEQYVTDALNLLKESVDKLELCSNLDTIYYLFSMLLSQVRQRKREEITAIFASDKKIAEEKKALEKKLDSVPEYAELHYKEECLFQFIEHIASIKNNIVWLLKEDENG